MDKSKYGTLKAVLEKKYKIEIEPDGQMKALDFIEAVEKMGVILASKQGDSGLIMEEYGFPTEEPTPIINDRED